MSSSTSAEVVKKLVSNTLNPEVGPLLPCAKLQERWTLTNQ